MPAPANPRIRNRTRPADYEGAWKRALELYFGGFMALLWSELHGQIDWTHPPVFLDKELQRLPGYQSKRRCGGRLLVDKLVRVRLQREKEKAEQIGIQKGQEVGRQVGQLKGATEVLAALITRKFGALPDWARVRMDQADEATLSRWAVQILDARRIEDVFA